MVPRMYLCNRLLAIKTLAPNSRRKAASHAQQGGKGVRGATDAVGGEQLASVVAALEKGGTVLVYGEAVATKLRMT